MPHILPRGFAIVFAFPSVNMFIFSPEENSANSVGKKMPLNNLLHIFGTMSSISATRQCPERTAAILANLADHTSQFAYQKQGMEDVLFESFYTPMVIMPPTPGQVQSREIAPNRIF